MIEATAWLIIFVISTGVFAFSGICIKFQQRKLLVHVKNQQDSWKVFTMAVFSLEYDDKGKAIYKKLIYCLWACVASFGLIVLSVNMLKTI